MQLFINCERINLPFTALTVDFIAQQSYLISNSSGFHNTISFIMNSQFTTPAKSDQLNDSFVSDKHLDWSAISNETYVPLFGPPSPSSLIESHDELDSKSISRGFILICPMLCNICSHDRNVNMLQASPLEESFFSKKK